MKKVKLSTGMEVEYDENAPGTLLEIIISDILIPKYKENKDWNLTLNIVLKEINTLISEYDLDSKLKIEMLNHIEDHLDKDIEELTGVAKIEILFLNMDDYVQDIKKILTSGRDKFGIREDMAKLIQPLTVFELGELFIYLGKEAFLK